MFIILLLQVVMGYSHSLVIARQDTEQEQEKLKKLPEYNPRTIWLGLQQQHLNPFTGAETSNAQQEQLLVSCTSRMVRVSLKDLHTSQLPENWLYINLDTEIKENGTGHEQIFWMLQHSQ